MDITLVTQSDKAPRAVSHLFRFVIGMAIVSALLAAVFLFYFGLPDATVVKLLQQCSDTLRTEVYLPLIESRSNSDALNEKAEGESVFTDEQMQVLHELLKNIRCPGAIHYKNGVPNDEQHYIATPMVPTLNFEAGERFILACDQPGNHPLDDTEIVNFLLSDGSVQTKRVKSIEYQQWADQFVIGTGSTFPLKWTPIIGPRASDS